MCEFFCSMHLHKLLRFIWFSWCIVTASLKIHLWSFRWKIKKSSNFDDFFHIPSKLHIRYILLAFAILTTFLAFPAFVSEVQSRLARLNDLHTNLRLRLRLAFAKCSGQTLDRLVTVSSMHYCTSTPALSTSSSSRGLTSFEWDISSWGGLHA